MDFVAQYSEKNVISSNNKVRENPKTRVRFLSRDLFREFYKALQMFREKWHLWESIFAEPNSEG